jgi:hypothetical protein
MSVTNQTSKHSYELDILKVANSLGIDQKRLLAFVYANGDQKKECDEGVPNNMQ